MATSNQPGSRAGNAIAAAIFATSLVAFSAPAFAGRVIASNDEWMFTNYALGLGTNDDAAFALSTMNWLAGAGAGQQVLILSSNFGVADTAYRSLLTGGGYAVTQTATTPASLAAYAAVVVAGDPVDNTLLTNYVHGGGSVLVEAGTGWGGPVVEAANWNPFLNSVGLQLAPAYNGVCCNVDVSAFAGQGPYGPALFGGVNTLYINNGNNVSLAATHFATDQVFSDANGNGLYGAYSSPTPEPGTWALMAAGLGLLGLSARRRGA